MIRALAVSAIMTLALPPAAAEPRAYRTAISFELATVQPSAIAVELDRGLGKRQLSVAVALGVRTAALGDYSSWTYGAGLELRRWRTHAMRGLYAGLHTDVTATRSTYEMEDRTLGTMLTATFGASIGYRIILIGSVELTPSVGLGAVVERGPMSPISARGAGVVGLTAGVIF